MTTGTTTPQMPTVYEKGMDYPPDNPIRRVVDQFVNDLTDLIRTGLLQELEEALNGGPALPPAPRRQPTYKPSEDDLTPAEARTLASLRAAGGPLTTWDVANRTDRSESTVRYQLTRLLKKKMVRRWETDDGRIVYKPY